MSSRCNSGLSHQFEGRPSDNVDATHAITTNEQLITVAFNHLFSINMLDQETKDFITKQVAQHFQTLSQSTVKEIKLDEDNLTHCCCDFTAHCPVHGSRSFDPDCYIAQG